MQIVHHEGRQADLNGCMHQQNEQVCAQLLTFKLQKCPTYVPHSKRCPQVMALNHRDLASGSTQKCGLGPCSITCSMASNQQLCFARRFNQMQLKSMSQKTSSFRRDVWGSPPAQQSFLARWKRFTDEIGCVVVPMQVICTQSCVLHQTRAHCSMHSHLQGLCEVVHRYTVCDDVKGVVWVGQAGLRIQVTHSPFCELLILFQLVCVCTRKGGKHSLSS